MASWVGRGLGLAANVGHGIDDLRKQGINEASVWAAQQQQLRNLQEQDTQRAANAALSATWGAPMEPSTISEVTSKAMPVAPAAPRNMNVEELLPKVPQLGSGLTSTVPALPMSPADPPATQAALAQEPEKPVGSGAYRAGASTREFAKAASEAVSPLFVPGIIAERMARPVRAGIMDWMRGVTGISPAEAPPPREFVGRIGGGPGMPAGAAKPIATPPAASPQVAPMPTPGSAPRPMTMAPPAAPNLSPVASVAPGGMPAIASSPMASAVSGGMPSPARLTDGTIYSGAGSAGSSGKMRMLDLQIAQLARQIDALRPYAASPNVTGTLNELNNKLMQTQLGKLQMGFHEALAVAGSSGDVRPVVAYLHSNGAPISVAAGTQNGVPMYQLVDFNGRPMSAPLGVLPFLNALRNQYDTEFALAQQKYAQEAQLEHIKGRYQNVGTAITAMGGVNSALIRAEAEAEKPHNYGQYTTTTSSAPMWGKNGRVYMLQPGAPATENAPAGQPTVVPLLQPSNMGPQVPLGPRPGPQGLLDFNTVIGR